MKRGEPAIIKLSQRLQAVADLTSPWRRIADIGSDHAYLPIYLMAANKIDYAVAGEVIPGPFEIAQAHIKQAGYQQQIKARLADGLAAIQSADEIQCVVLAGMGGRLITEILNREPNIYQYLQGLVLEPNQDVPFVRQWVADHGWRITAERIVFDEGHCYQMMLVQPEPVQRPYSPVELLMGPLLLSATPRDPVFTKYWTFKLKQREQLIVQLNQAQQLPVAKLQQLKQEIALIKEGLAC
ncbi:tRNA (adenine(22)-N(1))-methyltransferase [Lapidilactobacillus wuchangensis]|uniref:tRNA (adenine(22)-N(1))-methyltransferase n=1 Tax=Lapidilactobacillus wuchangensis TaxID=2486001 RepID=UPI000F7A23F4|nr:class I SAM-dependent methyltransferase [Lapidilactobacillus wuchangensis]